MRLIRTELPENLKVGDRLVFEDNGFAAPVPLTTVQAGDGGVYVEWGDSETAAGSAVLPTAYTVLVVE